jgi:2-oxoglutarate dehydrogenase E1 component
MTPGPFTGVNAGYVLELYERYQQNPESVDAATRTAFEQWKPVEAAGGATAPVDIHAPATVHAIVAATTLADSIRRYGHLCAMLDPLGSQPIGDPSLLTESYGITDDDLRQLPASLVGGPVAETSTTALEAIEKLRRVYCSTVGFDYAQIFLPDERDWLRHAAESGRFLPPMDPESTSELLDRITQVEVFERFLQRTFPGKTRFSLEGLDMLVPILDELIAGPSNHGTRHTIIGMAHRGRLNVLTHILQKPYAQILAEFKDPVLSQRLRVDLGWMGDVKYHAGARTSSSLGRAFVTMPPNPSHLEAVNPVVVGMARAAGTFTADSGAPRFSSAMTLPVLIHGDAAFPGQGIVAETLNLARLEGYNTGGSIHIIANNQLGFTATTSETNSSTNASCLASAFKRTILNVKPYQPVASQESASLHT